MSSMYFAIVASLASVSSDTLTTDELLRNRQVGLSRGHSPPQRPYAEEIGGGIPGEYDVLTFCDVVHDAHDPLRLPRAARAALRPDGIRLIQEINGNEDLEANIGPSGTVLNGLSLPHCTTQALAAGGAALGACGQPEPRLRGSASRLGSPPPASRRGITGRPLRSLPLTGRTRSEVVARFGRSSGPTGSW